MMKKIFLGGMVLSLFLAPVGVSAAALYFLPERTSIQINEVVKLPIMLDTEGESVNALEIKIPVPDGVEIVGIEKGNSIIGLWVTEPYYDKSTKEIIMLGGIPGGFNGVGPVAIIDLKQTRQEPAELMFGSGIQVLANDGNGTPVKLILEGTRLNIGISGTVKVSSETNPDETKWYSNRKVEISWEKKEDAEYSILLDDNSSSVPDTQSEDVIVPQVFEGVPDGIHYFHIQEKINGTWGEPTHFRIQVDTTPPGDFSLSREGNSLIWNTEDKVSGVQKYELEFIPRPFTKWFSGRDINSPLKISALSRFLGGTYKIKAVDLAGNTKEASYELGGSIIGPIVITLVLIGGILWGMLKLFKRRQVGLK